ncbi:hypothetical protein NDU88_002926 [Pleurodeles waltl]|uniref:Uncharacterized protein n=1 Tax=Pleurodeles waltl TaxID=8319 RepID=A0AAV7PBG9_PLEWA|nr:hypothetical protein NDU88_002926 [Pleurodeles waltl]
MSGPVRDVKMGNSKKFDKVAGKDPQLTDWGKDCNNTFYSLTEESDLSSADRSFSESEGSETSEAGNKSPSNELTVRQYRQRNFVRIRPGSQEGFENAVSTSGRTLKWDYSSIVLADIPTSGSQGPVNEKIDTGASAGNPGNAYTMGTEAGILQSIYSSIKELQTETRIESRRARIATKRLQGTVRKVAKSCTEIEAKLCSMEERIVAVEEDVDTLKEQSSARDGQLTDVMWKMEDLENKQRRNNLRFLGIPEGLEGNNIQGEALILVVSRLTPVEHEKGSDVSSNRAHRDAKDSVHEVEVGADGLLVMDEAAEACLTSDGTPVLKKRGADSGALGSERSPVRNGEKQ